MSTVIRIDDAKALAQAAAETVAGWLRSALSEQPRASLALSGGRTPLLAYQALALSTLDWAHIDFFFVDERCVPPEHPDSNFRLVREALFDRIVARDTQVFRMQGEMPDRDAAARAYEARLPDRLDVAVLGLGEDGHTASLFPGSSALAEDTRRVVAVVGPKPPPHRLTLTPVALRAVRHTLVLASGNEKADAVRRALEDEGTIEETPGRLAREALWLLDTQAATQLRGEPS
ncbi:MAG: 6-phosphogluconolactonase [Myxococcaceae bacterium]